MSSSETRNSSPEISPYSPYQDEEEQSGDRDEEPSDELSEDSDEGPEVSLPFLSSAMFPRQGRHLFSSCGLHKKLPVEPEPLASDLALELNLATAANNARHKAPLKSLDDGVRPGPPSLSRAGSFQRNGRESSSQPSTPRGCRPAFTVGNTARMLLKRELGGPDMCQGWSHAQQRNMQAYRRLPRYPQAVVDEMESRAYIGQFSKNGDFFIAAFQDQHVRLYDVQDGWRLRKDVTTRRSRWTITDSAVSPDQRFMVYSSILPIVHLVHVGSRCDIVDSIANVTEIHEPLNFSMNSSEANTYRRDFGVWSLDWSSDGREIIAGTNDHSVYVYDIEQNKPIIRIEAADDDVNAVSYADDTPNIIVSGGDDSFLRVWDRRTVSNGHNRAAGVFVGHTEGVTHIDARGDGRHLISNCKDQTIRLWDMRVMKSEAEVRGMDMSRVPSFNWDYRWMGYPGEGYAITHPYDVSLMTYRGHHTLQTLIRAYFSPAETTGQRFIYSGSQDGSVYVYDVVTGKLVDRLQHHRALVRDCSWHPTLPLFVTVSWDGTIVSWDPVCTHTTPLGSPGADRMSEYY